MARRPRTRVRDGFALAALGILGCSPFGGADNLTPPVDGGGSPPDASGPGTFADAGDAEGSAPSSGPSLKSYAAAVLAAAPTAYWRFEEPGGLVAADETGRHPAQNGAVCGRGSGLIEGSLRSAQWTGPCAIEAPGAIDFPGMSAFTIEAWVHPGITDSRRTILSKQGGGSEVSLMFEASQLTFNRGPTSARTTAFGYPPPIEAVTIYVVAVYDGSQMVVFVDGNRGQVVSTGAALPPMTGATLFIGTRGTTDYLDGRIDELAIYPRALSQSEITLHFKAGRP
jgi:hypothetical protein